MSQFGCVEECPTSDSLKTYLMFNGTITQFPTYASIRLVSICFPTSESMANTIDLGLNFYDEAISDLQATWPISLATLFIALFVSIVLMLMIRALGRCLVFTIIALYFVILVLFGVLCFETADDRIKIEGFDEWKDP
jgi:amino acid transporter